jgi:sulfite reductase (NADPH) hemoprotein beta-component
MNGAYLQLHAHVLRIATPYGTLSSAQLHPLTRIASKYDREYGHFTTRQNWERPSRRSSSERTPFGP